MLCGWARCTARKAGTSGTRTGVAPLGRDVARVRERLPARCTGGAGIVRDARLVRAVRVHRVDARRARSPSRSTRERDLRAVRRPRRVAIVAVDRPSAAAALLPSAFAEIDVGRRRRRLSASNTSLVPSGDQSGSSATRSTMTGDCSVPSGSHASRPWPVLREARSDPRAATNVGLAHGCGASGRSGDDRAAVPFRSTVRNVDATVALEAAASPSRPAGDPPLIRRPRPAQSQL